MVIIWIDSFDERIDKSNTDMINQINTWYSDWGGELLELIRCELNNEERYGTVIFTTQSNITETKRVVEKQLNEWIELGNGHRRNYDIF